MFLIDLKRNELILNKVNKKYEVCIFITNLNFIK